MPRSDVPLVLRRAGTTGKGQAGEEEKWYILKGEAYMHGIMHGEGMLSALLTKYVAADSASSKKGSERNDDDDSGAEAQANGRVEEIRKRLMETYSYDVGLRKPFPKELLKRALEDVVFV